MRNTELQWLLQQLQPNYHTISDFRKAHAKPLQHMFKLYVQFLGDAGLLGKTTIAVDGSKFKAVNSRKNNYNQKKIDKFLIGIGFGGRNSEAPAHGIYLIPRTDPLLGKLHPSLESIAQAIAEREHVRIRPAGAYALNKLGLSTQVPMKLVYITDGAPRQIRIGKGGIKFKATTPKRLSLKGKISSLVIQALDELGLKAIDDEMKRKIQLLLEKENTKDLKADIKLAPAWINDFIYSLKINK